MRTYVLWTVSLLACYLWIGYYLARLALYIWEKKRNEGILPLLLFPMSVQMASVGSQGDGFMVDEEGYVLAMTTGWPVKLVFNTICLTIILIMVMSGKVAPVASRGALWFLQLPEKLVKLLLHR